MHTIFPTGRRTGWEVEEREGRGCVSGDRRNRKFAGNQVEDRVEVCRGDEGGRRKVGKRKLAEISGTEEMI